MKTAFIFHGSLGSPDENWLPWLKIELEKLGFQVVVPNFPTPQNQSLDSWLRVFEAHKEILNQDSILIGHSLGSAFILRLLEASNTPVKACLLVAGFTTGLGDPQFDQVNASFLEKEFDWLKIKANCSSFFVFHSDNDPFVPLKHGQELADRLGAELILVKGAGHFNEAAGYKEFPLLLEKINSL